MCLYCRYESAATAADPHRCGRRSTDDSELTGRSQSDGSIGCQSAAGREPAECR